MKTQILYMLAGMIVDKIEPEKLKEWADTGIDMLEDAIESSETEVDDKLALPVIKAAREAFAIPDND